ncbi:MAG: hypothetical protein K0Q49_2381 [Haloplasmataceae bacterium]|jgi:hypothetical protein|nr:hypothetical protein [Haloplasmataceae bacterium]
MLLKEFLEIFISFVPVLFKDSFNTLHAIGDYSCNRKTVDGNHNEFIPLNLLNMKISFVYASGSNVSIYLK